MELLGKFKNLIVSNKVLKFSFVWLHGTYFAGVLLNPSQTCQLLSLSVQR